MKTFEIVLSEERNVTMTLYLNLESPEFHYPARPLMMVLPGGGYSMCSDREAEVVALPYLTAGYQVCILRYTLKQKDGWPHPLNDYDAAIDTVAAHAEEWRIDMSRVAVVGFSAGGHLAACTATLAKHRPRAAICVYPAILKEIVDACQPNMPYPHEHVDAHTSPCYLVTVRDDSLVNCKNTLQFALALEEKGIQFETHVYSYGNHGFSTGAPLIAVDPISPRVAQWVQGSIGWLGEIMGALTENGYTKPILGRTMNGDGEAFLSVHCTFAHLRQQSAEVQKLLEPLLDSMRARAEAGGYSFETLCAFLSRYTLQALINTLQMPVQQIEQLDAALQTIPNPSANQ